MKKTVIILNGRGGVGKDYLCKYAADHIKIKNVSSITPIKEIAKQHGWNGEKDDRSRAFLSDLKDAFAKFNDLPNQYLLEQYEDFKKSDEQIMFVQIRESEQIERFKEELPGESVSLLVERSAQSEKTYGNVSDDNVEDYSYDYYFDNNLPKEEAKAAFLKLLLEILDKAG